MDLIILAGSSGNGKTTVGKKLHELLKTPFMEFTWIPEFRTLNPHTSIIFEWLDSRSSLE